MVRHLYYRTIERNGKKVKSWYYWFYDENGKQVRRSCGKDGKPCLKKRDAEEFLASLEDEYESRKTFASQFAGMYNADSDYMKKALSKGKHWEDSTIHTKQQLLEIVMKKFGNRYPEDVSLAEIDKWLLSFDRSSSWRNQILAIFKDIYLELYQCKRIQILPVFQYFVSEKKEKGILSLEEIQRLFPSNYDDLVNIWRWNSKTYEPDWQVFIFATMIFTCLSTGMRRGELRALKYSQFVAPNAVLINCRLDQSNKEINRLKKGTDTDKKWRVSILPKKTVDMIHYMTEHRMEIKPSPYLFTFHGHPWGTTHLRKVLAEILTKNGIDVEKRNISLHSLRFTYNTIMKTKIDNVDLRLMMGHVHENMTEYYDKSKALDHLDELQKNKSTIDSIWD
ncbi:site-specific integrase [Treponema sp.]|uniref:tyrosine-type recombinase/integrase n=1 Tax=Treponema sp. TaxID=166 RepID=UPI00298E8C7B|nr:site-specific integrase [Treponema sp.]MCQ2242032.1 site-specific integrase [Treponema sp.]